MILINLWFLTILAPGFMPSMHDFHLSKCDINFNTEEGSLQIGMHLFVDDLEAVLSLQGHDGLNLCTDKELPHAEQVVFDYINRHFGIWDDDVKIETEWIGKEASDDLAGIWCYFEITGVSTENELQLQNTIMLELFDDQRNIVKVTADHKRIDYFLFDHKDFKGYFEI